MDAVHVEESEPVDPRLDRRLRRAVAAEQDEVADFGFELLRDMSARIEEPAFAEYDRAVRQVLAHLETDSMMMQKAVLKHGLAGERAKEPRAELRE